MPTPKQRLLIDFDQDGDWSEGINDVSGDIRRLTYNIGKNIIKQRAEAGTLDIIVNNEDHKFSPSNPSSPLHPYITIGPEVWLQLGYPVDDFDAADATTLTGRKPSHDSLFDVWAGDTGDFDVLTNKIRTASGANKSAVLEFEESDCWVGVDFTRNGSNSGLICRWLDANNYLLVRSDGSTLRLSTCTAGVLADVATKAHTWTAGDEKRINVELHGTAVRVYVDHVLQIDTTTSSFETETQHGVGGRATDSADRWDNFGGWRDVFFGRLDSVNPKPRNIHQYAYLRCFDDLERLGLHQVYRTAPTAPATAKQIFGEVLDAADADSSNRVLDNGATLTTDPAFEAVMGGSGQEELYQVQDDDAGFFYITGGVYHYEGVDHRDSAPHSTPRKIWSADRLAESQSDIVIEDADWDDNKQSIENEGYYHYFRFSLGTLAEVWKLQTEGVAGERDRPAIAANTTLTFLAVGQGDGISSPETPFPSTRFQIWTAEDETGTELTASQDSQQGTVSATGSAAYQLDDTGQDFTDWNDGDHVIVITDAGGDRAIGFIAATNPDGDGTRIDIKTKSDLAAAGYAYSESSFSESDTPLTYGVYQCWAEVVAGYEGNFRRVAVRNGSGTAGFVTLLQLFAKEMTQTVKTAARFEDTDSQSAFGRRRIEHQTKHIDRWATALDRVTERIQRRMALRIHLQPTMGNATRANLMQIIHRSISDRVEIDYAKMGLSIDAFIENQKVEIKEGGTDVVCTWGLVEDPKQRSGLGGSFFPNKEAASGGRAGIHGALSGGTKNWATTSAMPNTPNLLSAIRFSEIVNNKVYVLDPGDKDGNKLYFYEYNLLTDSWTTLTAPSVHTHASLAPRPNGLQRLTSPDRYVTLWGIRSSNGTAGDRLAIYTPSTDSWSESSVPAVPTWDANTTIVYGVATDGADTVWVWATGKASAVNKSRILKYTVSTDTWDYSAADMAANDRVASGWVQGDYVYGTEDTGAGLHRYQISTTTYSETTLPAAPGTFSRLYAPGPVNWGYFPIYGFDIGGGSTNLGSKLGYSFVGGAPTETDHLQVWDFFVITDASDPGDEDDVRSVGMSEDLSQVIMVLESDSDWTPARTTPYVYF